MENKEKKNSIVKRMIFAVVAGFVVGFLSLFLREFLNGHGNGNVWNIINAIFFQDITTTDGFEGLGLFYIIGQLFMRGLQMAIVPLVLTSLSLASAVWQIRNALEKSQEEHLLHIFAFM